MHLKFYQLCPACFINWASQWHFTHLFTFSNVLVKCVPFVMFENVMVLVCIDLCSGTLWAISPARGVLRSIAFLCRQVFTKKNCVFLLLHTICAPYLSSFVIFSMLRTSIQGTIKAMVAGLVDVLKQPSFLPLAKHSFQSTLLMLHTGRHLPGSF